jgi:4-azaleucine resistance transporter AzlC
LPSSFPPGGSRDDFPIILREGVLAAWPIWLGYVPIGLAFGVLAEKGGLLPAEIGLMSFLVFAGSSQFIAVSMLASGASSGAIVATTFAVNLRHLLMSSSLAVHLGSLGRAGLSLFAYGITDESFAVNWTRFREGHWHWREALVVNHTSNAVWVSSTVAGGYLGQFIPAGAFGLDYALIAMFLCLLVFQLRGRIYLLTALLAGGLSVMLSLAVPGNTYIVIASASAAMIGALVRHRYSTKPAGNKEDR